MAPKSEIVLLPRPACARRNLASHKQIPPNPAKLRLSRKPGLVACFVSVGAFGSLSWSLAGLVGVGAVVRQLWLVWWHARASGDCVSRRSAAIRLGMPVVLGGGIGRCV